MSRLLFIINWYCIKQHPPQWTNIGRNCRGCVKPTFNIIKHVIHCWLLLQTIDFEYDSLSTTTWYCVHYEPLTGMINLWSIIPHHSPLFIISSIFLFCNHFYNSQSLVPTFLISRNQLNDISLSWSSANHQPIISQASAQWYIHQI